MRHRGYKHDDRFPHLPLSYLKSVEDWDLMWADVRWIKYNLDLSNLKSHQRVNHFKNHCELTGKDNLIINLKNKARELKQQGKIEEALRYEQCIPPSFILPDEYEQFYEEFKKHSGTYIMKPVRLLIGWEC